MDRTVTVVLGQTGSGKSYCVKQSILPAVSPPVFVLDPDHEYDAHHDAPVMGERGAIYEEGDPWEGGNPVRGMLTCLRERLTTDADIHVVRPSLEDHRRQHAQGIDFARAVSQLRTSCTVIVDEAQIWSDAREFEGPFRNLILRGRKHGQSLIFCTQRSVNISKNAVSQSHAVISFYQHHDADVKRLGDIFANPGRLRDLAPRECLIGGYAYQEAEYFPQLSKDYSL